MGRERKSKDVETNKEGEEMLKKAEELGLVILNGYKEEDGKGELTYLGTAGVSTIDYVLANTEADENIESMKIEGRIESDHMPIEILMKCKMVRNSIKQKREYIS